MSNRKIALMIAACIVSACSQELETSPTMLRITAHTDNVGTRTVLNPDYSVSFADGDCIAVFDGDGNKQKFITSSVYDDGSADFSGTIATATSNYVAVYPYQDDCDFDGEYVSFAIPNVQAAVAGSFDPAANISIGVTTGISDGIHSLELKNTCALMKFSVPEGLSYQTAILVSFDNILAGNMKCTAGDSPSLIPVDEVPSSAITLQGTIEGGKWYYIAVNPTVLTGGFALYLFDHAAEEYELASYSTVKATGSTVTLQRSKILNLGIIGAEPEAAFEPLDGETVLNWD